MDELIAAAVVVPYDDYAAADVAVVVVKDESEALED